MTDITFLQNSGVIFVVLAHSFIVGAPYSDWMLEMKNFVHSFPMMPLFMLISGYLFIASGGRRGASFSSFTWKKAKRLFIPYLVLGNLGFGIKLILSGFANRPVDFSLVSFIHSNLYPRDNAVVTYWFLPTLFIILLFSGFFEKAVWNKKQALLMTAVLICLRLFHPVEIELLNLSETCDYFLYFWLGCLTFAYKEKLRFLEKAVVPAILFLMVIILYIIPYRNDILNVMTSISGVYMCYFISRIRPVRFIYISGYYFQIYLLSWFTQQIFVVLFYRILDINLYISSLTVFVGGLLLPVVITKLVSRYMPVFNPIIGQKTRATARSREVLSAGKA